MAFAMALAGVTCRYRDTRSLSQPGCVQVPINSEQLPCWPSDRAFPGKVFAER